METNIVTGKLYLICEWIMKLAYVNILWVLFTASGLVIFGAMPATVAVFAIARKWMIQGSSTPIFKTFLHTYKSEFAKSNFLGLVIGFGGSFLVFDFVYIKNISGNFQLFLLVALLITAIFFFITMLFILPVYVHYELKLIQYFQHAFLIGMANIQMFLAMLAGMGILAIMFYWIPGLIPLFAVPLSSFIMMWCSLQGFKRIEIKQKKNQAELEFGK